MATNQVSTAVQAPLAWTVVLNDVKNISVTDESKLPDLGAVNAAIDKLDAEQLRRFAHGWQAYYEVFDFGMNKALSRIKHEALFTQYLDTDGNVYKSWGAYVEGELKFSVSKANSMVSAYDNLVLEKIGFEKLNGLTGSAITLISQVATRKNVDLLVTQCLGKPIREVALIVQGIKEKNPAKVKANQAAQEAKQAEKEAKQAEKEAAKQAEIDAAVAAALAGVAAADEVQDANDLLNAGSASYSKGLSSVAGHHQQEFQTIDFAALGEVITDEQLTTLFKVVSVATLIKAFNASGKKGVKMVKTHASPKPKTKSASVQADHATVTPEQPAA